MATTTSTTPSKLGAKAKRLWESITTTYDLRPDELRVLEDACREIDLVERFERALVGAKLTVKGSMGQPVANPLVQEIRQHRQVLKSLLASLKLPDEPGDTSTAKQESASSKARAAAEARWRRGA